jgi:hypothetical protein
MIEERYNLIGNYAVDSFTCFSVNDDQVFEAHLDEFAPIIIPFKSLVIENIFN